MFFLQLVVWFLIKGRLFSVKSKEAHFDVY